MRELAKKDRNLSGQQLKSETGWSLNQDYKLDTLPATLSLGTWKKWKHDLEIYLDTIGPSWRGVKVVLQQGCHSGFPLVLARDGMNDVFVNAGGEDAFEPALFEYAAKASTLFKLLVPKLNLDLSTDFRNAAPDNGFELWRLLNSKLDPPRADIEFHLTNDIRKHARTNCTSFE